MFRGLLHTIVLACGLAALVLAQPGGGGGGGMEGGGGGAGGPGGGGMEGGMARMAPEYRYDSIFSMLKYSKEQKENAAPAILEAAQQEASSLRTGLLQSRASIVNAIIQKKEQAELGQVLQQYEGLFQKMTAIEIKATQDLLALAKPNLRSKTPAVFALMNGLFATSNWRTVKK